MWVKYNKKYITNSRQRISYHMYKSQYFEWLRACTVNMMVIKDLIMQKNSLVFDGVGTNYTFITHFVIRINWHGFSFKGDGTSVLSIWSSIQLAVLQPQMESNVRFQLQSLRYEKFVYHQQIKISRVFNRIATFYNKYIKQ